MAFELPVDLTPELVPLSWLLGRWEGYGMLGEGAADDQRFFQRVTFEQIGLPVVEYRAETWLADDEGQVIRPIAVETGFWQLERELTESDGGPGLIPGDVVPALRNAEDVEKLRTERDGREGFALNVTIAHPGGITEQYSGHIAGPQVFLETAGVQRSQYAHPYDRATRIYGLVNEMLFWRWDVAGDAGEELAAHGSAQLKRVAPGGRRHAADNNGSSNGDAAEGTEESAGGEGTD
ncbi:MULTISPECIES: nitrobindin family protein [Micrococcaceae]|uniref:Peroxynitrite isomerase n=1 Tax=Pseudoglutamicibacter albus TaxID=98671 RepID=A0ABU1Z0I0_9MICC|nr:MULTISPECIES: FABP family protein [Micrococcaceae]MDR7294116.1 hypothetical protein [Pseudoglutamicibacter albus]